MSRNVIITNRMCESPVKSRTKIYDRKCPGLYVSKTESGVASFSIKFTDKTIGKQRTGYLGVYNPETFNIEHARSKAWGLKGKGGRAAVETLRQHQSAADKLGKTVNQLIPMYVEYLQGKDEGGNGVPLKDTWETTESALNRFLGEAFGDRLANEIINDDIATLSKEIMAGKYSDREAKKGYVSSARLMRTAASGLFKWARMAGNRFVETNPCLDLPTLPEEPPCERTLSEDELRTFWFGLDRDDLPYSRKIRLNYKLQLATMLRGGELRPMQRDWLNANHGTVDIPAKWVKKRRVINQPLNSIAQGLIEEAMGDNDYVFAGRKNGEPLSRQAMSGALAGSTRKRANGRLVRTPGICELLGLDPFTPHDLRRTAATMLGDMEDVPDYVISLCLDHQKNKDKDGNPLPTITKKVYNKATRKTVREKRKVLDIWAVELQRILDNKPVVERDADRFEWLLAA